MAISGGSFPPRCKTAVTHSRATQIAADQSRRFTVSPIMA
jgi:hypothetical protein